MLIALLRWLAHRSVPTAHALGAVTGRIVWMLSPAWRRKTRVHLAAAGLDAPRMRRAAARHAGMLAAETPGVWLRDPAALVNDLVEPPDWSQAEAMRREAGGLILLTPHLGGFEVAARMYARVAPITVLYKPPKRDDLRTLVEGARAQENLHTAPASLAGVRALLRALKRGETIGILPDQVPGAGEGVWAPFFGRPAFTMTLPMKLAQATGAAVVLVVCERVEGRGWRLHTEPFRGEPTPQAVNAAMERLVRRFPEQYLWGYARYKRPPGAPPASDAA